MMMISSSYECSFGALLKGWRTRRHLTQQHLATSVGVHRNAIGRWEQGDVLPASKTMVLELARQLALSDTETRQFLEASLTALWPHWLVPWSRNPFFTGREAVLEAIHARLHAEQVVALTQSYALHGLGGVGKTQVALEYAYRHALEYRAVFWIGSETEESIISNLLRVAEVLQLPERAEKDQQLVVAAILRWLTTHSQWLLIWDNLEDLNLLDRFLPSARQGFVLITTRCHALGTFARGLDLLPMEQQEGRLLLLRRAKVLSPEAPSEQMCQLAGQMPAQYAAAGELVTALGGLPLALDQAGAYIEETQCGLPAYLELFQGWRTPLLQQRGVGSHHPASVSTTFTLAITTTAERHPAIWDLLRICALLPPDAIPEELFRQGGEHLGVTLSPVCGDLLEWDRLVAIACAYSLLSRQPEMQSLFMHRLVQAVLLDGMTKAEQEQWAWRAIRALDATFPEVTSGSEGGIWKQCERLLPHVLAVAARISDQIADQNVADVLRRAADYLRGRAQYEQAEALYQRVLRIQEHALGSEHLEIASSLRGLAIIYEEQEKYEQAELFYQRALRIWEQTLGARDPQVANLLDDLGILSAQQGKYEQAEPLFQQAWRIREQTREAGPLEVTKSLYNLAELYREQGKHAQAEPLFERALHIQEQTLGPEHHRVAYALGGLADLYRQQGKYEQGKALFERALHLREQLFGPDHPQVAYPLHGLAGLYTEQGKYEQAELLYMRALRIREQALGSDHLETARSLAGLARLFEKLGKAEQAESMLHRVCLIFAQHLGQTHPETVKAREEHRSLLKQRKRATQTMMKEPRVPASLLQASASQTSLPFDTLSRKDSEAAVQEDDTLTDFLAACCELHPLARCRIRDLWQTYEQWMALCQGHIPLSRRAFAAQVKARGCRVDRTSAVRIWRGIRLVNKHV